MIKPSWSNRYIYFTAHIAKRSEEMAAGAEVPDDLSIDCDPGQVVSAVDLEAAHGETVAPARLAEAMRANPGVKAVLRMPTDRGGEGVAVVAVGYWAAMASTF